MSSLSAFTSLVPSPVLAARAYVLKLDMFLASIANVGPGANQRMVVGTMQVFEKWLWHKGQAAEVTWSWEEELREWCMARCMENSGAAWLAPFEANFAPAPPLIDKQLASLLADDGPFSVSNLSALKVATYVEPLVQMDLACQELEAVAAEELADESTAQDNKEADNEDEAPVTPKTVLTIGSSSPSPAVVKRASKSTTPSKWRSQKVVPQYKHNFEKAVLVHRTQAFVLAQWSLATAGGTTFISTASLALPTAQELGIAVDVAVLEPTTPKGKAKVIAMPQKWRASSSGNEQPVKRSQSSTAS
ncbi:hypothetical protein C0992_004823 [Termitomyces sp. T32_za158]|nr:hypothetical protein C0992_004823 [Termitomyces sp. T32_za158]